MPLPTSAIVLVFFVTLAGVYSITTRRGGTVAVRPTPWIPPKPCLSSASPTMDVTFTPATPASASRASRSKSAVFISCVGVSTSREASGGRRRWAATTLRVGHGDRLPVGRTDDDRDARPLLLGLLAVVRSLGRASKSGRQRATASAAGR